LPKQALCYILVNQPFVQGRFLQEGQMTRVEMIVLGVALVATASPAFAGNNVPAPIAGVGIGAVLLIGVGYRALKSRMGR
jgi:hypothetical protein